MCKQKIKNRLLKRFNELDLNSFDYEFDKDKFLFNLDHINRKEQSIFDTIMRVRNAYINEFGCSKFKIDSNNNFNRILSNRKNDLDCLTEICFIQSFSF